MNNAALAEYLLKFASNVVQGMGIRISVTDYRRWNRAIQKVTTRASYWIEDEMQRLCAIELSHKQIGNICPAAGLGHILPTTYSMLHGRQNTSPALIGF